MKSKIIDVTGKLVINVRTRDWCKLPYPDHPNGCPNFGISNVCPPKVCLIEDFINLKRKHFFVIVRFNLQQHAERMKDTHPAWSDKQCICCLYWQNGVRSRLRKECEEFCKNTNFVYTLIPEAMGVDVFSTFRNLDLTIDRKPTIIVRKVALIGIKR